MNQPLPVTVLSGFAGAGKTSVIDHVMAHREARRVAVISAIGDDLSAHITRLAASGEFDAVLVEAPSSADPQAIAEDLVFDNDVAHIDTMVTVVDAERFMTDYASAESLHEDDDRTVVEALVGQIEFCDVIVVNKTDLIDATALEKLMAVLHALNPRADLYDALNGDVPVDAIIAADRFDFDATSSAPGWLAMLNDPVADSFENKDGIGGFVYRARRPFHPGRLWTLLHQEWPDVLRCKGFFWLATRSDIGGSLSQSGGVLRHSPAGMWWAAQDRSEWPTGDAELEAEIAAEWVGDPDDASIGDRRQELALIGVALDETHWRSAFDACLLSDEEWAAVRDHGLALDDPFPSWELDDEDDDHHGHEHHGHDHHDH